MRDVRCGDLSRADLVRWGAELMVQTGLSGEYGFHLIRWDHEGGCPLNPVTNPFHELSNHCRCRPNATILLHVGTPEEHCIPVVLNGVVLVADRTVSAPKR